MKLHLTPSKSFSEQDTFVCSQFITILTMSFIPLKKNFEKN